MFEKCLGALAHRGLQVAISSSSTPRVSFDLVDFYHNEARLIGVDTLKLSFSETAEILRELTPAIEQGDLPPPEVQSWPLERGPKAYRELERPPLRRAFANSRQPTNGVVWTCRPQGIRDGDLHELRPLDG